MYCQLYEKVRLCLFTLKIAFFTIQRSHFVLKGTLILDFRRAFTPPMAPQIIQNFRVVLTKL